MTDIEIRTVDVIQYIHPLREGGSLPGLVRADDDFDYVLKFRGAGQGKKALTAELVGGLLAKEIGLKVPELVFMNLDESFSITEPDQEIQDLFKFSTGLNLGLHFLSGAIMFDPLVSIADSISASKVVLLDIMINNIDRTTKNANLLNWKKELWLIDHGASLYFHHNWKTWETHVEKMLPNIRDHVLLKRANDLEKAASEIKSSLKKTKIEKIISLIPEDWLIQESMPLSTEDMRNAYVTFLNSKLDKIESLAKQASNAK